MKKLVISPIEITYQNPPMSLARAEEKAKLAKCSWKECGQIARWEFPDSPSIPKACSLHLAPISLALLPWVADETPVRDCSDYGT
jgi:hypothetical protein